MLDAKDEVLFDARFKDDEFFPISAEGSDSEADGDLQGGRYRQENNEENAGRITPVYGAAEFEDDDDLPLDPPAGVTIEEWARLRRLRLMSKAHIQDSDKWGFMDNLLSAFCVILVWGSLLVVLVNLAHLALTGNHLPGVAGGWSWAQDAVAKSWAFTRAPVHTHMMTVFDPEYAASLPTDQGLYEAYMHGSPKQRRKIVETFTEGKADARDVALMSQQRREDAMQQHRWSLDGSAVVSAAPPDILQESGYDGVDARVERYLQSVRRRREGVSMWPPPHAEATAKHPFADAQRNSRPFPEHGQRSPPQAEHKVDQTTSVGANGGVSSTDGTTAAQYFMSRRAALIKAGLPPDVAEQVAAKELKLGAAN